MRVLPGTWKIGATNFAMWLGGARHDAVMRYELKGDDPLVFDDFVSWTTAKNKDKTLQGTDYWTGEEFVWKGTGVLSLLTSRWTIAGASADESILVIRFSSSLVTAAGIDVIVREGTDASELRASVAHNSHELGLTPSEFASLTWLEII